MARRQSRGRGGLFPLVTLQKNVPLPSFAIMRSARYLGVEGYIGRTPLLRLRRLSELTGCEILGKAEFMNPGGSVKDRAALGIIEEAEARGILQPGATIVEGTAGNTGIGLTIVGRAK